MTLYNGPLSAFRLEGDNKIIYLFGDYHNHQTKQSECKPKTKNTIIEYIIENVKNSSDLVDIMIEIYYNIPKFSTIGDYNNPPRMIDKINSFISNNVIIEKNFDKTINKGSKIKNTRFHYINIRHEIGYTFMTTILDSINQKDKKEHTQLIILYYIGCLFILQLNLYMYKKIYNDNEMFNNLNIGEEINKIKNFNNKNNNNFISDIEYNFENYNYYSKITKIFNKIFKNRDILNSVLGLPFELCFKNIFKIIDMIFKLVYEHLKYKKNTLKDIIEYIKYLDTEMLDLYALFNDYYTIYRINKKYIKKAVFYGGNYHTSNILLYLLTNNYKLTHISNYHNSLTIEAIINKKDELLSINKGNIDRTFFSYINENVKDYQCIDMKSFPKNFD